MSKRLGLVLGLCIAIGAASLLAFASRSPKMTPKGKPLPQGLATLKGQTATLLPSGDVLILGGEGPDGPLSAASMRNVQTGILRTLPHSLLHPRYGHTATLLPDGSVLILGGVGATGRVEAAAELFDPSTAEFRSLPPNGLTPRAYHTATLLTDGRLLIAGGLSSSGETLGSIELWDFRTNSVTNTAAALLIPRTKQAATLLADGSVLFWGGFDRTGTVLAFGEVFDPVAQRMRMETTSPIQQAMSGQPPQLEASLPQDKATSVALNSLIALRFSKPLNVLAVNAQTATLSGPQGLVDGKVVPAEGGMLAFITPNASLLPGTAYMVSL